MSDEKKLRKELENKGKKRKSAPALKIGDNTSKRLEVNLPPSSVAKKPTGPLASSSTSGIPVCSNDDEGVGSGSSHSLCRNKHRKERYRGGQRNTQSWKTEYENKSRAKRSYHAFPSGSKSKSRPAQSRRPHGKPCNRVAQQRDARGSQSRQHLTDEGSCSSADIPGFYYDEEKKKYFKILPGHNNFNVVTRETVARKKAEQKRVHDLKGKHTLTVSSSRAKCAKRGKRTPTSLVHLWTARHQGDITMTKLGPVVLNSQITRLHHAKSVKVFPSPFGSFENLEHMQLMDASADCCDILGLWSVKDTLVHRIQLLHVDVNKPKVKVDRHPALDVEVSPCGNIVLQSLNKITHVCWAPSLENPARKCILYTTMCYTGYSPSLALFRNLESGSQEDFRYSDFCLGNKVTWTCAWNPHKNGFSVGTEKSGLLLDVETRRLWEMFTNNSDVLSQVFTPGNGMALLSGTRKGEILTHDLRSRSTYPVKALYQHSPISSLKLLQDETYLLASDFKSRINLWDLRMRRVVMEFKGHSNQYSKLPIHVDETEQVIYLVGEDNYTRFWNLKTGEIITSLPPPCPASRQTIPVALYSQHWGGQWGQCGVIMGLKDELHFYDSSHSLMD